MRGWNLPRRCKDEVQSKDNVHAILYYIINTRANSRFFSSLFYFANVKPLMVLTVNLILLTEPGGLRRVQVSHLFLVLRAIFIFAGLAVATPNVGRHVGCNSVSNLSFIERNYLLLAVAIPVGGLVG